MRRRVGRRGGGGGEEGRVGVHVCVGVCMCVNKVGGGGRGREGYLLLWQGPIFTHN